MTLSPFTVSGNQSRDCGNPQILSPIQIVDISKDKVIQEVEIQDGKVTIHFGNTEQSSIVSEYGTL